ncbi:hypothetical protein HanXRQr2_Chr01g0029321 [Helianthus annuus]|uniref:Uncharacterized protein n=1 Tax=Helianthus annuus TaxID=4232 RepID=A0A9K3JX62_HELAN|nr:hypothetical protein HanXRQr2_Chr01g0029321 [Helianthus annuus]KAJ0957544.1 hypothetical protein HanPSC8_Chr01g0028511 [Helianthus annuus]
MHLKHSYRIMAPTTFAFGEARGNIKTSFAMLSLFSASIVDFGWIIIFSRCGEQSSRSFTKRSSGLDPSKDVISTVCNMSNV